ncbi:MAG: hypothetical protein M3O46_02220 [Myxococcota bacterium]|nr:hypothetical protein [Myxococcota bacterium]
MHARARLSIAALALAILQACSGDDKGTGSDASDAQTSNVPETGPARMEGGALGSDADAATRTDGTVAGPDANGLPDSAAAATDAPDDGDGAVACTTPLYTHVSTFSSIFDGWTITNNSTASLFPMTAMDGATSGTIVTLDTAVGSPAPGSAKLAIPFDGVSQQLIFAFNSPMPLNLTGTTVSAQIKLDSGLNVSPVNPGRAYLVLKSTIGYTYAPGPAVFLDPTAGFVTLTMSADAPTSTTPGYTACDIREIDVVIETGPMGTYTAAVVHIDTIAITAPGVDGGTDGAPPAQADASRDGNSDAAAASDAADSGG